jgi:Xaa-Pro aminopeptidase
MEKIKFPYQEFSLGEYRLRIENAKELMKKHKIDALLIFCTENLRYYSGFVKPSYGYTKEWRQGFIIPREDDPVMIVPHIRYKNAQLTTWVENIKPWGGPENLSYPQDCTKVLIETIKELRLENKVVGAELSDTMLPDISIIEFEAIRNSLPNVRFVDAANLIWEQRTVKTPMEQKIIMENCDKTCKALKKALAELHANMTEWELYRKMWESFISEGILEAPMAGRMLMRSRGRYDVFNIGPTNYKLRKGDTLLIDGGPRYKGYFCDVQRVICIGDPPEKMKKMYEAALQSLETSISIIKPGVRACDVYHTAVNTLRKTYPGYTPIIKFVGHGIGLCTHEPPYLTPENDALLKEGMYLAVEVGVLDIPKFEVVSAFPEEDLLVTKDGCKVLTEGLSRELWTVE